MTATRERLLALGPGRPSEVTVTPATPPDLTGLRTGQRGHVARIVATAPGHVGRRLQELGFAPGAEVLALRRAPLGDPVVYRVAGSELSLRRSEARLVLLDPGGPETTP